MTLRLIPHLHRTTHQIGLFLDQRRDELDVSQAEAHILAHLSDHGDSSIADLHKSFGHKRSTLSSILNRLEEQRLIVRKVHPTDRRSYMLQLTRTGKPRAAKVRKALEHLERTAMAQLSRAQRDAFIAALAALEAAAES